MKNFRERLAEWRHRHHLNRDKAGAMLGVTGHYVGMIERGDKEVAEGSTLDRLLACYERDANQTDTIIRDHRATLCGADNGKALSSSDNNTFSLPVSRLTFECLSSAARERDLPLSDLADLAVMQYCSRIETMRKKHE